MGVVVDTSCLVDLERRLATTPLERSLLPAEPVLASVVAGELLVGLEFADGPNRARRQAFFDTLLAEAPLLPFDLAAARRYASIVATLRRRGERIGDRDAMIAATALANGHSVMTANTAEFSRIPGLTVLAPP